MRFLVTGVNGQLGYDVVRELKNRGFYDILECGREQMNITDKNKVYNCICKSYVDVVIHCAAYTAVDKAEDESKEAFKINVEGSKNIAESCKEIAAKLIYISTDYVFDGKKSLNESYNILDKVNPLNVYGKTKREGELVSLINPKTFIVRTSWVFGINGNNFVKTMLKLAKFKDEIDVVSDQYGSPTYTKDLAKLLVDMSLTEKYGIYHANNEGYTNWAEFASKIFELNNSEIKVNKITTDMYPTKALRPTNSCLNKSCLDKNGFERLPDWQDALERYIDELNNTKKEGSSRILKR